MVKYLNCFKAMNRFWTEIETKNKTGKTIERDREILRGRDTMLGKKDLNLTF